jgi:hypothetical protein
MHLPTHNFPDFCFFTYKTLTLLFIKKTIKYILFAALGLFGIACISAGLSSILAYLFVLSLGCLIAGLIKPSLFNKVFKKELTRKQTSAYFGGGALVILFVVGITGPAGTTNTLPVPQTNTIKTPTSTTPQTAPAVAQSSAPVPKQPEQAPVVIKPKTTLDLLWDAFDNSIRDRSQKFEIAFDEKNGQVTLTKPPTDNFWDEFSLLNGAYKDFVKFGLKAFEVNEVKDFKLIEKVTLTDKYGKSSIADGVILQMTKAQFQKFNWEDMKGRNLYSDAYTNDFEDTFVNFAIAKVVLQSPDKISLSY